MDRSQAQAVIEACHASTAKLLDAAKAVMKPTSYYISYHLAALALEEIGKASMVFVESLPSRLRDPKNEERSLMEAIDDHEQKLFWALWLPLFHHRPDWRSIPETIKLARRIHQTRLDTLYVDPNNLNAPASISEDQVKNILELAETRLAMERASTFRDVPEQEQKDLEWFFDISRHPRFGPFVFSKTSFDKHAELKGDPNQWIAWLRETFTEIERVNTELTVNEMNRVVPEGIAAHEDKFQMTLRLVSWSHSIRQNQLNKWNKGVNKLKLTAVQGRPRELIVQITMPKLFKGEAIYGAGYQNSLIFVAALNMATMGFFWWYVPKFVSRYYEKIHDLEANADLIVEREPKLEPSWGHLAMKEADYNNLGQVWAMLMKSTSDPKKAFFIQQYVTVLSVMAKNDIFAQFEPQCLIQLANALRAGLFAFGDWDGKDETWNAAVQKVFDFGTRGADLVALVNDTLQQVKEIQTKGVQNPVTVEDLVKAKIVVDLYVNLKTKELLPSILSELQNQDQIR